ncbi:MULTISPECIES: monovalent cation/H(+) antiporter subunit G [Alcaligenes]|uniref:monovalent cation/H(+) antiporter subunit G n=1 Tax=Alcaligenes TaxID=507 RepID=UPI001E4DDCB0|nr:MULTISPECIES: monovalent cation/H(+) antiporter subunit G [unclassified Alcaligenes]MCC9162310.1 monovalent cation/H(+) antiporter subunit G [Alcaligenes sp. MMA]UYY85837.1 monovalent cation/H(+) antiporter subunit G [Alcaligenes sp. SMD-FA]
MTTPLLPWWLAVPVALLLVLSGIVALVGSAGLLRFKHFYSRIHAPTMGNTLGTFFMVLAVAISASHLMSRPILHPLILSVLLIITSPVTAIFLMRAAIKREHRQRLAKYGPDEPGYLDMPHKAPLPKELAEPPTSDRT